MIIHGRNAFPCNVMHTNQGPVEAFSKKSNVQTVREFHEHGFGGFKHLRVTNSHARIVVYIFSKVT